MRGIYMHVDGITSCTRYRFVCICIVPMCTLVVFCMCVFYLNYINKNTRGECNFFSNFNFSTFAL